MLTFQQPMLSWALRGVCLPQLVVHSVERANSSKGRLEEEIHIHEQRSQRDHDVTLYSRCHDLTTSVHFVQMCFFWSWIRLILYKAPFVVNSGRQKSDASSSKVTTTVPSLQEGTVVDYGIFTSLKLQVFYSGHFNLHSMTHSIWRSFILIEKDFTKSPLSEKKMWIPSRRHLKCVEVTRFCFNWIKKKNQILLPKILTY